MSWDISKKVSMSMGARTNIPIKKQKQYFSFQYSLKYVPADNHSLIFSAGQYHNYTQPDYYNLKYKFKLKKIVGKEIYSSPSCLTLFFQNGTLGFPTFNAFNGKVIYSSIKENDLFMTFRAIKNE